MAKFKMFNFWLCVFFIILWCQFYKVGINFCLYFFGQNIKKGEVKINLIIDIFIKFCINRYRNIIVIILEVCLIGGKK